MRSQWAEDKRRSEIAERKRKAEATRDPELEHCVIAYVNWRRDGGQGGFDAFKRDWYAQRHKAT